MKKTLEVLVGQIESSLSVIDDLSRFITEFRAGELPSRGKDRVAALA